MVMRRSTFFPVNTIAARSASADVVVIALRFAVVFFGFSDLSDRFPTAVHIWLV